MEIFNHANLCFEHIKQESEALQLKLENYLKVKNQGASTEIENQAKYGDVDY